MSDWLLLLMGVCMKRALYVHFRVSLYLYQSGFDAKHQHPIQST